MLDQMLSFFTSAFYLPGLRWNMALIAIFLALVFGAVWLILYRPLLIRKPGLWIVAVAGALLTWTAIAFIQIPLQSFAGSALLVIWSQDTLLTWLPLAGIPQMLLSGLVQEASKLVPVIVYSKNNHWRLLPKLGLIAGAVSGAGFGVFEAVWVHNTIFASGWTWSVVEANGILALLGFWERFFTVGFHIATSALAGYGLAKGMGWRFYLLAAVLHGILNYSVVLLQAGILNSIGVEIYIAVVAIATTAFALWLRWRNQQLTTAPSNDLNTSP